MRLGWREHRMAKPVSSASQMNRDPRGGRLEGLDQALGQPLGHGNFPGTHREDFLGQCFGSVLRCH